MGIELTVNIALLLGSVFCFWNVGVNMPPPPVPGAMSAATWPRIILAGLIIALMFNIRNVARANNAPGAKKEIALRDFFSREFLLSALVMVAYALSLDYLGFLLATFLFVLIFSYVIGLKKRGQLVLGAVSASIGMYVIFQVLLQVMLPRGEGIFRQFSLWLEILAT